MLVRWLSLNSELFGRAANNESRLIGYRVLR